MTKTQSLDHLKIPPVRAFMVCEDVEDDPSSLPRTMECFLNPDSLKFKTGAEWAHIAVPGYSQEVLQYSHTRSNAISFNIQWDYRLAKDRMRAVYDDLYSDLGNLNQTPVRAKSLALGMLYKEFLYSLTLPVKEGRAPSRVTLIWPGFLQFRGVVTDVDFGFNRFGHSGGVLSFEAGIEMTELRVVFMSRKGIQNFFNRTPVDRVTSGEPDEQTKIYRKSQGKTNKESTSTTSSVFVKHDKL